MKNALALIAAALAAPAMAVGGPAQADDRWPDVPYEVGAGAPIDRAVGIPYRCSDGPVYNFLPRRVLRRTAPGGFSRLRLSAFLSVHGLSRHSSNVFLPDEVASLESFGAEGGEPAPAR